MMSVLYSDDNDVATCRDDVLKNSLPPPPRVSSRSPSTPRSSQSRQFQFPPDTEPSSTSTLRHKQSMTTLGLPPPAPGSPTDPVMNQHILTTMIGTTAVRLRPKPKNFIVRSVSGLLASATGGSSGSRRRETVSRGGLDVVGDVLSEGHGAAFASQHPEKAMLPFTCHERFVFIRPREMAVCYATKEPKSNYATENRCHLTGISYVPIGEVFEVPLPRPDGTNSHQTLVGPARPQNEASKPYILIQAMPSIKGPGSVASASGSGTTDTLEIRLHVIQPELHTVWVAVLHHLIHRRTAWLLNRSAGEFLGDLDLTRRAFFLAISRMAHQNRRHIGGAVDGIAHLTNDPAAGDRWDVSVTVRPAGAPTPPPPPAMVILQQQQQNQAAMKKMEASGSVRSRGTAMNDRSIFASAKYGSRPHSRADTVATSAPKLERTWSIKLRRPGMGNFRSGRERDRLMQCDEDEVEGDVCPTRAQSSGEHLTSNVPRSSSSLADQRPSPLTPLSTSVPGPAQAKALAGVSDTFDALALSFRRHSSGKELNNVGSGGIRVSSSKVSATTSEDKSARSPSRASSKLTIRELAAGGRPKAVSVTSTSDASSCSTLKPPSRMGTAASSATASPASRQQNHRPQLAPLRVPPSMPLPAVPSPRTQSNSGSSPVTPRIVSPIMVPLGRRISTNSTMLSSPGTPRSPPTSTDFRQTTGKHPQQPPAISASSRSRRNTSRTKWSGRMNSIGSLASLLTSSGPLPGAVSPAGVGFPSSPVWSRLPSIDDTPVSPTKHTTPRSCGTPDRRDKSSGRLRTASVSIYEDVSTSSESPISPYRQHHLPSERRIRKSSMSSAQGETSYHAVQEELAQRSVSDTPHPSKKKKQKKQQHQQQGEREHQPRPSRRLAGLVSMADVGFIFGGSGNNSSSRH
ncbi:hypothetical protein PYCC9005_003126 [Savitreella phatthalungensis]